MAKIWRPSVSSHLQALPLLLLLLLILVATPPPQTLADYSQYSPAYAHDPDINLTRSDWMSTLDDSVALLELSLPGTHDSMAFFGGDIAHTQTLPLAVQLRSGIRVFDIRCRHVDDKLAIHHGRVFQHAWFNDVLDVMVTFLREQPTEAVLMRVTKEYKDHNNSRSFTETFLSYQLMPEYAPYFWYPPPSTPTPTRIVSTKGGQFTITVLDPAAFPQEEDRTRLQLGELRGKILILDDFSDSVLDKDASVSPFGLNYPVDFNTQDAYVLKTNWDLYSKWSKIKSHLYDANSSWADPTRSQIYLNYLSGSTGVLPYFVASGHITHATRGRRLPTGFAQPPWPASKWPDFPREDCVLHVCQILFEGTNTLAYDYMTGKGGDSWDYVGFIMADFPGPGLIDAIIDLNHKNRTKVHRSRRRRRRLEPNLANEARAEFTVHLNLFLLLSFAFICTVIIYWIARIRAQLAPKVNLTNVHNHKYEIV